MAGWPPRTRSASPDPAGPAEPPAHSKPDPPRAGQKRWFMSGRMRIGTVVVPRLQQSVENAEATRSAVDKPG